MLGLFLLTLAQAPVPATLEAPPLQRPAALEANRADPPPVSDPPAAPGPSGLETTTEWAPLAPPDPEALPAAPGAGDMVEPPPVVAPPPVLVGEPASPAVPAPVSFTPVGADPDWRADRMQDPTPRWKGTGGFVTAGLLGTAVFLKQASLTGLCGGEGNCGLPGVSDRIIFAGSLAAAMAGSARRGRWDAAEDVRRGRVRDTRMREKVGFGLAGAGLVLVVMDTAFNGACYLRGTGPYASGSDGFLFPGCRTGVSTAVIDMGYVATVVGFPMAIHSRVYRRNARARLAVAPWRMEAGGGVMISGRF